MAAIKQFLARLRALFGAADLDRDFADEMQAHLEMAIEDNIRAGMTPEEARRQAALRLGGATSLQSRHRDTRGFRPIEEIAQLRFVPRLDEPDAPPQEWRTIVGVVPTIAQGLQ